MKLRSANAFWLLKNGILETYPSLKEDINCDVLVVGGGITGALIAFQLSSEGRDTALIDKNDVAFGSTAATTAMLQYELDKPLYALIEAIGEERAVDIYQAGVDSITELEELIGDLGIECGFRRKNSLYIARSAKDKAWLATEFETRRQSELEVEWLTSEDLTKRYHINGAAAICSSAAASLDAYKLSHELLRIASKKHGLRVFDHTSRVDVDYSAEKLATHTDGGHIIKSDWVIYATGYETQFMLKDKIVDLVSTYVCISEPLELPQYLSQTILWTTDSPYLYLRSTPDNRILIGGEDEPFRDPGTRDKLIEKKENSLLKKMRVMLPDIGISPDFSWAGTFGITHDALPYIGPHKDFPKSLFVLGYGGNGITFSVLAMKIISDVLAGRDNKFLDYLKFNR
jgi:glycine/D-amino acid oxidase-like deaminating enzyme